MNKRVLRPIRGLLSVLIGFGIVVAPGLANASTQWVADKVRNVYPQGDGSFIIVFVTLQPSCPSASSPQYFYVSPGQNGANADGVKGMLATTLTAFATGTKITVAFDNATSYCYVNRLSLGD